MKKYRYWFFTILYMLLIFSCSDESGKLFLTSFTLDDELYLEKYSSSGGAHGSDYFYLYVTDSINFKKSVGVHDEKEFISVNAHIDKIEVIKYRERGNNEKADTIFFNLNDLRNSHVWEN